MYRRSARNHKPPQEDVSRVSRSKAAKIDFDEHPELLLQILSAMEVNSRWREGICSYSLYAGYEFLESRRFQREREHHRERCLMEMARQFFSRHPTFRDAFKRKPASFARAIGEKLESFEKPRRHQSEPRPSRDVDELDLVSVRQYRNLKPETWKGHRTQHERDTGASAPSYTPFLPLELQDIIATEAILTETSLAKPEIDYAVATRLRLVNSDWRAVVDTHFFRDVTVSNQHQHEPLFGPFGALVSHPGAGKYVETLRVHFLPDMYFVGNDQSLRVKEFHHDMSHMRFELEDRARASSRCRIEFIANLCIPLYQLIISSKAPTLRLTWARVDKKEERAHKDFWRDLIGAHLASLRLMSSCRHLIVDGGAYLQVLPPVVSDWTQQPNWQTIVSVLREQNDSNDGVMPTMLDESNVENLTFCDPDVPTLAILAAMSQGKQVKVINLRGWDGDEETMPQDWKDFLAAEKTERFQAAAGTGERDGRSGLRWIRSSGAEL
ncbi:hypothetical protein M407DRAFT_20598 [Tulasnella calospora MUT 4182]|uniref:Uncharacterized protein n=1 Tax=Tulasnella calospora MUT 4182 TaxID=1051891 RepID=A0A0C3QRF3_9AGAM|nr:hypothetical protein M407DRAFT_20598 [Tulasnella calospora MUT 4182]